VALRAETLLLRRTYSSKRAALVAGISSMRWSTVEAEAARKRDERGGFDQRILLEYVDQAN
jgi:hypothetical protein